MKRTAVDDVDPDPHPVGINEDRRGVSDAIDADRLTLTHYKLDPGEAFSVGLYTYRDREEIFYITEGVVTFEHRPRTEPAETEKTEVRAGEIVRFSAEEYRRGRNDGDGTVAAITVRTGGDPRRESMESLAPCRRCEELTAHSVEDGEEYALRCLDCGTEMQLG